METALRSGRPRERKQEREDSFHSSFQHHAPPGQRPNELARRIERRVPFNGQSR
ncbi:hypothetical protein CRENBAI_010114, partial [Crenichthys baileyi]